MKLFPRTIVLSLVLIAGNLSAEEPTKNFSVNRTQSFETIEPDYTTQKIKSEDERAYKSEGTENVQSLQHSFDDDIRTFQQVQQYFHHELTPQGHAIF